LGLAAACGGGIETEVRSAASAAEPPEGLVVIYDDIDDERGGQRIEVRGDRSLRVVRVRPGGSSDEALRWSGTVPDEALRALVDLLVEIEVWEQRVEDEDGRLEDARATVHVRVGGERAATWEWVTDLESRGRLVRVKQHLEALAFEARHPMVDGGSMAGGGGD
jgi:hypothetical protein